MSKKEDSLPPDRDYGATWSDRLEEARKRNKHRSAPLSSEEIAGIQQATASLDVSSPLDSALFWSGKDVLTGIRLDESAGDGRLWWDKYAPLDAGVFRKLGLAVSVEDTPCGRYLLGLDLNFAPDDPLVAMPRSLWEVVSARFAQAARGRVEILVEGAWEDGVFRSVELAGLLANTSITSINGLDRVLLPENPELAFSTLRRWNLERSRRYLEFLDQTQDATSREREIALDDQREMQLFYEQDFFDKLGPNRKWPDLSPDILSAPDRTHSAGAWKYSRVWREYVQSEGRAAAERQDKR